ncbi:MAG TPA: carboxypeptidase-like regulatory domain-containing protein [Anaeromyxobacter sp.]|nr:carboxypeptidase-like regulatory domain-containing protein [Anaeromyxobacter sp.]
MKRSRLQWTAAAVALVTPLLLAACGGGGGGSEGPITVSGTVVNGAGTPVSGADVVLNGDDASILTTGADGAFSYAQVKPPYNLTVKSATTVIEFRGLRRAAPQIVTSSEGLSYGATLAGNVTGPTYPLVHQCIWLGASNGVLTTGTTSSGAYSAGFLWPAGLSTTTDLAALYGQGDCQNAPTAFYQVGKRTGVTAQNGVGQVGLDIDLSTAVNTRSTVLDYSPGAYSSSPHATYLMVYAGGAHFLLALLQSTLPSGASVPFPEGGGTFLVAGHDAQGNMATRIGKAVLGGTTRLDLPTSTALSNSQPLDGATVSKTPSLSWTPVSGAALYVVTVEASGLEYRFYLPGDSATLSLPDYSALGLPLAGNTTYTWTALAMKWSGMDPDALTDPAVGGLGLAQLFQATDLTYYNSQQTSFTTTP